MAGRRAPALTRAFGVASLWVKRDPLLGKDRGQRQLKRMGNIFNPPLAKLAPRVIRRAWPDDSLAKAHSSVVCAPCAADCVPPRGC